MDIRLGDCIEDTEEWAVVGTTDPISTRGALEIQRVGW